jgi:hypothetical protein
MPEQVDSVREGVMAKLQTFLDSLSADERSLVVQDLRSTVSGSDQEVESFGLLSSGSNDLTAADCWYIMTHAKPFGKTSGGQAWYPDGSNKNPGAGGKPK